MSNLAWDKEFALEQAADDAELLQELLDIFKDSCANDLNLIEEGIATENVDQVRGAAHSIKGAAASLGIHGIRDVAFRIESEAIQGSLANAKDSLNRLQSLAQELMLL